MSTEVKVVFSRKAAFRLAWRLFQMASGTSRVGMLIKTDPTTIQLVGNDLIEEL